MLIATQGGARTGPRRAGADAARPEDLRGDVEENLRQLGRDHLDLVHLRNSRSASIGEHFAALAQLRDAGLTATSGSAA